MSTQRFDHQPVTLPGGETYAESRGEQPFDWNAFLERVSAGEILITSDEYQRTTKRAQGWICCTVGNQCAVIPRSSIGEPLDDQLRDLGATFFYDLKAGRLRHAQTTLAAIEARSAELIAQLRP